MHLNDTIAAISTPQGCGGIGVIRLSGPRAVDIAAKFFKPSGSTRLKYAKSHTIHFGRIENRGETIDEAMASVFLAPKSYTGEDVVELSAHGGPVILDRIMKLLLSSGARSAGPGEFTYRAYMNGKLDLAKAEAVAGLISSRTELAAKAAFDVLKGSLSRKMSALKKQLVDLLSKIEVKLDYAEEDIEFVNKKQAVKEINSLILETNKLLKTYSKGRILADGLRTTITGKPNTGKSSLLNALLERERAIVTDVPGTTRDVIEETLDIGGIPVMISDTAGLRADPRDKVEKIGHELASESLKNAGLVLCLVDASRPLGREDAHVAGVLRSLGAEKRTIVLLNKSDLPSGVSAGEVKRLFKGFPLFLKISALNGSGIGVLEKHIVSSAKAAYKPGEPVIARQRHFEALSNAVKSLEGAKKSSETGYTEEISAFHLREALNYFGVITGETATEEILDNIFKNFCVGK